MGGQSAAHSSHRRFEHDGGLRLDSGEIGRTHAGRPGFAGNIAMGRVLDDILLVALCYAPEEIKNQVLYIPV
jgi:hypothetical protein